MAASATAKAILISRAAACLSIKPNFLPPEQLLIRPLHLSSSLKKRGAISCLISGVDGGGVSDEFVSIRKSSFRREFSVLANMLKTIEPLDNSIISKGVSDSAKDSMKQTISTMFGLLPSDQFSVTVRFSKRPFENLLVSSIVTGYTLWNVEYRISLMRNFDVSMDMSKMTNSDEVDGVSEVRWEEIDGGGTEKGLGSGVEDLGRLGDISPEALSYIQQLESELSAAKQELEDCRQENLQMEHMKESNNNLLEYLRSLESNMVMELSKPSSPEVEEIVHQLAQNIMRGFFKDETDSDYAEKSPLRSIQNHQDKDDEFLDIVGTSRDYLAKLLFWCMLLGHHLRGLENRLHLSCAVGLL